MESPNRKFKKISREERELLEKLLDIENKKGSRLFGRVFR